MIPTDCTNLLEQLKTPVLLTGAEGNWLWSNKAFNEWCTSLDLEKEKWNTKPSNNETSSATGTFQLTQLNHTNGTKIDATVTTSPVLLSDKTFVYVHIVKSISDEAVQTTELDKIKEELDQFMYVASHDIQAPLRTIASYIQLVQKSLDKAQIERALEFMPFLSEGVNKLQLLIDGLLILSRVSRKGARFETVNLEVLVKILLEGFSEKIKSFDAIVNVGNMPSVQGDSQQLKILFENLIDNALKFTSSNKKPIIEITATERFDDIIFTVKDNGIGIEPKFFERIFVVFQRLHHTSQFEGAGAGLAICKKIVERHGGKIWVESEKDTGSTFYFTLAK